MKTSVSKTVSFLVLSAVIILGVSFIYTKFNTTSSSINSNRLTAQVGGAALTVDLKANGSDGPITPSLGSDVTVSWTTNDPTLTCYPRGNTGVKFGPYLDGEAQPANGQADLKVLTSNITITIECSGSSGTAKDSVTINVIKAELKINGVHVYDVNAAKLGAIIIPYNEKLGRNDDMTVSWTATPGAECRVQEPSSFEIWSGTIGANGQGQTTWNIDRLYEKRGYSGSGGSIFAGSQLDGTYVMACFSHGQMIIKDLVGRVYAERPPAKVYKVNLLANGTSRELTVPRNTDVLLTWTHNYGDTDCRAYGDWSGAKTPYGALIAPKSPSGREFTEALTSNKVYTIKCDEGGKSASEDTVTIYVTNQNTIPPPPTLTLEPKITKQPQNQTVMSLKIAMFICDASGSDVSFQWQFANPESSEFIDIPNATRYNYIFNPSKEYDGVRYRCVVTNSAGSDTSSAATLTVKDSYGLTPVAACDATAKAIVTALGGCSSIDQATYKNVYGACCTLVTKTTLLQILNDALADGVIDKTEKASLLSALNSYLSK